MLPYFLAVRARMDPCRKTICFHKTIRALIVRLPTTGIESVFINILHITEFFCTRAFFGAGMHACRTCR